MQKDWVKRILLHRLEQQRSVSARSMKTGYLFFLDYSDGSVEDLTQVERSGGSREAGPDDQNIRIHAPILARFILFAELPCIESNHEFTKAQGKPAKLL